MSTVILLHVKTHTSASSVVYRMKLSFDKSLIDFSFNYICDFALTIY